MDTAANLNLQNSAERYVKATELFRTAAELQFGLDISDQTLDCWRKTMQAARYMDILLDEEDGLTTDQKNDRFMVATEYIAGESPEYTPINPKTDAAIGALALCLQDIDPQNRRIFASTLRSIFKVTNCIKLTYSLNTYTQLTRLEGQLTARLLNLCLSENDGGTEEARQKFAKWLTRVGRFANVFDSTVDLAKDHSDGQTLIEPALRSQAKMMALSFKDLAYIVKHPKPKTIKHMFVGMVGTIKGRKNRYASTTVESC